MTLHLTGSAVFPLLWLPLAALAWYTYRHTRPGAGPGTTRLLTVLRAATLAVLLVLLAQPVLERWSRQVVRPGVLLLVDTSKSMALAEGDTTRLQRVVNVLTEAGLARSLKAIADVQAWGFAAGPVRLDLDTLASVRPVGRATDIAEALNTALEQVARRSAVRAVLVVSDGRHNLGPSPVKAAASAGVPVYGLIVGSGRHPADVQIAAVSPPVAAYVGRKFTLQVDVRAWGYAGRASTVRLDEAGRSLSERQIALPRDGEAVRAALVVRPGKAGTHIYRVSVPALADEAVTDNNEVLVPVDVREEKMRVLLMGAAPSADLAFLRRTLEADSSVVVEVREDLAERATEGALGQVLVRVRKCEVAVAVDPGSALLQGEFAQGVAAWVRQGGGLLWMFGPHTVDGWKRTGARLAFLPVDLPEHPVWQARSLTVRLTPAGMRHPIGRLLMDGESTTDPWPQLPPLPGYVPLTAVRQGGVVILAGAGANGPPVVVAGRLGRGRVVAALSAEFWRQDLLSLGAGRSSQAVRSLWRNAVRWLGTRVTGARLRVWSERRVYRSGDRLVFGAQTTDELLRPQEGVEVTLHVSPGDLLIPFADRGAGNYQATWQGLEPGEYTYAATAVAMGAQIGQDRGTFIVEPYSLESVDMRADPGQMEQMARASGGVALPLARWREVLGRLPLQKRVERRRTVLTLWPRSWCLGLVVALLLAEWVLRKRNGMI